MSDLEFATFDEIAEELKKRFSCCLIAISDDNRDGESMDWSIHYHSKRIFATLGLASAAVASLLETAKGVSVGLNEQPDDD